MKNWKTTFFGCAIAAGYAVISTMQAGKMETKDILISAGFAVLGILAKDFNVSGTGTTPAA